MAALDTNLLVRWLVDDDARQSEQVRQLFEATRRETKTLFIPITVALELEWVLRSRYGFGKRAIISTFCALLETQELEFQEEGALEFALHHYRESTADFADCMHAGQCAVAARVPLLTFDSRAARVAHIELVPA